MSPLSAPPPTPRGLQTIGDRSSRPIVDDGQLAPGQIKTQALPLQRQADDALLGGTIHLGDVVGGYRETPWCRRVSRADWQLKVELNSRT